MRVDNLIEPVVALFSSLILLTVLIFCLYLHGFETKELTKYQLLSK